MGAVFQALLEAALRDAAAGAFEDEQEDEGTGLPRYICFLPVLLHGLKSFLCKRALETQVTKLSL